MSRRPTCFVIMPMSDVGNVSASQWDDVYQELFRPSIEAAGFRCVRSMATIGSLMGGIIEDLWSADAVLADLTGMKANVFYELGVRHALRGRTIMIARDPNDVPSDLSGYARHIYDPHTPRGRTKFRKAIVGLLRYVRQHSDRPDNPIEDFLQDSRRLHGRLRLSHLAAPQRDACEHQMRECQRVIDEITRGYVPIPGGSRYLSYFIELIGEGDSTEKVKVFLATMPGGSRLKFDETAGKQMFQNLARLVQRRRMRIEYTCLFQSRSEYRDVAGHRMLERHCPFSESVRMVFGDEAKLLPHEIDKTIVIMERRRWAITHGWDQEGHAANPRLFVNRGEFTQLHRQYMSIRRNSEAFRCPR